jgi:hypothetical protein
MSNEAEHPNPFLEVRVHEITEPAGLTGLCAGYELGDWRCSQLASHLIEWLPDFALNHSERESMRSYNAAALLARAAHTVYTSSRYNRRGEIGELLLHIGIRQVFKTLPAISKYYYKDSSNETVKGFDAVHVVVSEQSLELWLGESKFYEDIEEAIRAAVTSLIDHTRREYLRAEFIAIANKIDDSWPHAARLKQLIDKNTSLDVIFDAVCIPVFLTYNSPTISSYTEVSQEFKKDFESEVRRHHADFIGRGLPNNVRIHLFLLPLKLKGELQKMFDERLKACQSILN